MLLNYLDACLLERLSHQDLKDWLNLHLVVKEIGIVVVDLDGNISAFLIRDVCRRRWSIDVIVRLDLRLMLHVVVVI